MFQKMALVIAVGVCMLVAGAGATLWGITTGRVWPVGRRISVYVDGRHIRGHGLVFMGRTYLPIRPVAESLGLSVETYKDSIYLRSRRLQPARNNTAQPRVSDY